MPLNLLGGLVILVLIAYGAFELIDVSARHTYNVRASYGRVRAVEVDDNTGDIHLVAGPAGSDLVVLAHVIEGLSAPRRQVLHPSAGVLHLSSKCPVFLDSNYCEVSYTVTVPAGASVNADSSDGDVDASDLSTTAPLKLSSSDGDVHALGISAGDVTLTSGNGDVSATLLRAPSRLTASSGAGDVKLTVPDVSYAATVSSSDGDVHDGTLKIDPTSSRKLSATSGNGDVSVSTSP